jgi:hypothetical protein
MTAPTPAEADTLLRTIRATLGIRAAAPYQARDVRSVEVPGAAVEPKSIDAAAIAPGYFEAWGLQLVAGRWFTPDEFSTGVGVAVVRVDGVLRRVIGVVVEEKRRLRLALPGQALVPAPDVAYSDWIVAWAPDATTSDVQARVESAIQNALPGWRVSIRPVTFEDLFLRDVGEAQFQAPIVVAFGVLAFLLAGIGVFGLVSYLVAQRTREYGIRFALGARPGDVWQSVIRQSLVPAVAGLAVGIAGAWALESVVRSSVFGWQSSGVGAIGAVAIALLGVTVFAAAWPARRAMRIDPAIVLRAE